jgi:hypothetical protein
VLRTDPAIGSDNYPTDLYDQLALWKKGIFGFTRGIGSSFANFAGTLTGLFRPSVIEI